MMIRPPALLFFLSLIISGCSGGIDNSRLRADVIEDMPGGFALGQLPMRPASAYLRAATAQGLVAFDAQGQVIPALASRWIVTDDGLSYIFRLEKIQWNDGRPVTSKQVADSLNIRIRELRNSALGRELTAVDRSVSMTGKIIEIRLKSPMPNLLELLAQPEFGLIDKGAGSGPMLAQKSGSAMQLRLKGFDESGDPVLSSERVILKPNLAAAALVRFKAGQTDVISGGRFHHLPLLSAANISGGLVQSDPVPGLFGLLFAETGPFLSLQSHREAIAMAIDRPRLLTSFDNFAWQESLTLMPETLQNRANIPPPRWSALPVTQRQELARGVVSQWEAANGNIRPLRISVPDNAGGRILFARIRADLAAIGLDAQRALPQRDADLRLLDIVADISSPSWYLGQLSCDVTPVCDKAADELVRQARQTSDPAERQRLLGEAELMLQETRNFIPLANPLRWSLTRDGLLGYAPNPRGLHLLQYLGRNPS